MIFVIKANTERELNHLATLTNLPDGKYVEVDDSSGCLIYTVFSCFEGEREEKEADIDIALSLVDVIDKFEVEYIILSATGIDVHELTGSLLLANLNSMAYTVEEFLSHKTRLLN